jgi:hypothetical protein
LADFITACSMDAVPTEIHLSDCAITTEGFEVLMSAIEEQAGYPRANTFGRGVRLYLRIENNFIDCAAIQEKVDMNVIHMYKKKDTRVAAAEAKVDLLVQRDGEFQQKQGPPPAPEDAPPPREVMDHGNRISGKGQSKGQGKWTQSNSLQQGSWLENTSTLNGKGSWNAAPWGMATWASGTPWMHGGGKGGQPWQPWGSVGCSSNRPSVGDISNSKTSWKKGGAVVPARTVDRSRTPPPKSVKPHSDNNASSSLLAPWQEHWSDEYGIPYYWNPHTGDSLWEKPQA